MKYAIAVLWVAIQYLPLSAQKLDFYHQCHFDTISLKGSHRELKIFEKTGNDAVQNVINIIQSQANIEKEMLAIDHGSLSATARIEGSTRIINYNPVYLARVIEETGTEWAAVFVIAHEAAHHYEGHTLDYEKRLKQEIQADRRAAKTLYAMHAKRKEVLAWAQKIALLAPNDQIHNGRAARIQNIEAAYDEAAISEYPRFISLGVGARADMPLSLDEFRFTRKQEVNVTLSVHGLIRNLSRLTLQLEFPVVASRIETHDTYTTLTDFNGHSYNEYNLKSYNLNILYDLKDPQRYKRWNVFAGLSGAYFHQKPLKPISERSANEEQFLEHRTPNSGVGGRAIVGIWYEIHRNFRLDVYSGYCIYNRIKSQSFIFNYFGNASPEDHFRTMQNTFINARITCFLK
jgi:hypothetical protein